MAVANIIGSPIFMRSPEVQPLLPALRSLQGPVNGEWGTLKTVLAIATIPLAILFMLSSRQPISGLTASAVK